MALTRTTKLLLAKYGYQDANWDTEINLNWDILDDLPATRTGVYRTVWVPASQMSARSSSGATSANNTYATDGRVVAVWNFSTATYDQAMFSLRLPDSWDLGVLHCKAYWTSGAVGGSGTVNWGMGATAARNDDTMDASGPSVGYVTDTFLVDNDLHIAPSNTVTVGGTPAAGAMLLCKVIRQNNDSYDREASLIGYAIQYKESATEVSSW